MNVNATTILWIIGAILQAVSLPLLGKGSDAQELTASLLCLVGSIVLVIGTGRLARSLGLSAWFGIAGVLNILGVLPFLLAKPSDTNTKIPSGAAPPAYAGILSRALAFLIDLLILAPFTYIGFRAIEKANLVQYLFSFLAFVLYKPLMEAKQGGTIGKQLCKIRVQDAYGHNLSLKAAYLRFYPLLLHSALNVAMCVMLFDNPFFTESATAESRSWAMHGNPFYRLKLLAALLAWVDVLFIFVFWSKKQTLHDLMAGSFCVQTNVRASGSDDDERTAPGTAQAS
jgi:uncharacterized RDD family membrane protein YckC